VNIVTILGFGVFPIFWGGNIVKNAKIQRNQSDVKKSRANVSRQNIKF
jgi:hypothetical protein